MSPTVLTDVSPSSRLLQDEIFGPVVVLSAFSTEAQAIAWANATPYGLSASVWTHHLDTMHRVCRQLSAGVIWGNCWLVRNLSMPFGGVKASGLGREGGHYSIDFFTQEKSICVALSP